MTQGKTLYTNIFKLVVNAVLWHWILMVVKEKADPELFVRYVQCMSAQLYSDNALLASTRAVRFQQAFDVLIELFDWVILKKNV